MLLFVAGLQLGDFSKLSRSKKYVSQCDLTGKNRTHFVKMCAR